MKREIKFRGKRADNGEWVYGFYMAIAGTHKILSANPDSPSGATYYEVIPSTVGQYTGMKDKNDVEIYEDDIIEAYKSPIYSEVVWDDGEWDIYCPFTYEYKTLIRACKFALVIGNIHDNHDLIEVKQSNE